MKKYELSYFAGLMDGEGCFNINFNKKRNTYQARITMSNTNYVLVQWCQEHVGGKIYKRKKYSPHHKEKWEWMSWGDKDTLMKLLTDVLPFLVGKREQCKVLIRFQKTLNKKGENKKIDDRTKKQREGLYQQIKMLNVNGLATTK
jgi:hypothetical protein